MSNIVIGLLGLGITCLVSFVIAFRNTKWTLVLLIPIITCFAYLTTFSYQDFLGYPVSKTWEEMPNELRVVFFKVNGKKSIDIWTQEGSKTRLIQLPASKEAESLLNKFKGAMKKGGIVTLEKVDPKDIEGPSGSFPYKFKSIGDVIPGSLPPK